MPAIIEMVIWMVIFPFIVLNFEFGPNGKENWGLQYVGSPFGNT